MKLTILATFLFSLIAACETQKNNTNALNYYVLINGGYLISQKAINKCYESIQKIGLKLQNETYSKVDAQDFGLILDSAINSNRQELELLKNIGEVDTSINYKSKLIDYKKALDSFYTIPCRNWISKLLSDSINKITVTKTILMEPLEHIVTMAQICDKAEKDFQMKYSIPEPEFIPSNSAGNKSN
jgi:hypothetical protein